MHNTQALSRRGCQVPGGRSAGLPTANRLTRHQECPKQRKFSSFLRTRRSQQIIFKLRMLFSRPFENDELWPTHKRYAPEALHPRKRHRCGRLNRPHPWCAAKPVCSPPTTAVVIVWPFGVFEYFEQSAQKSRRHTGTCKPANTWKLKSSEIRLQEDDTRQGIPETLVKTPMVSTVLKPRVSSQTLFVSLLRGRFPCYTIGVLAIPVLQGGQYRSNP